LIVPLLRRAEMLRLNVEIGGLNQGGGGAAQGDAGAQTMALTLTAVGTPMTCEEILLDHWRPSIQDGLMLGKLVGSPGFGSRLVTLRSVGWECEEKRRAYAYGEAET
jgi:hypothetical protein